jgi:predicted TIM-barrel fold metal-dependent hydrolase
VRIVDAHVHVWRRPFPDHAPVWRTPHPVEALLATLDEHGVHAAVQVTPSPEGVDNGYGLEVAARYPERLRVFGRIDAAAPDPDARLRAWMERPGAAGVRFTFFGEHGPGPGGLQEMDPFWAACERLGVPVAMFAPDHLEDLVRVLERRPRLRLIVDHLGLGVYPGCRDPLRGLALLPELASFDQVVAKISGLPEVSAEPFPFRDVHEHLASAVEAFGSRRLMWGSNHPVVAQHCSYAESLGYLGHCFLTDEDRAWILHRAVDTL